MSNISGINGSGNNIIIDGREQTNAPSKEAPIEVKNGSTLTGKVLSVTDTNGEKIANIDLGNATISAKLSEGMGLKEGQILSFSVRGTGPNGVTITPLLENTSTYQSTMKALMAAGLEVTGNSVQMVKEMMEAGLPIDKSSLLEMSKNLNTYSDTSVATLVEMKSLNIPINENNIEQYGNYKNYEHQVTMEMTEIIEELPKAFDSLMQSGNTSAAINLYGEVLKAFAGEEVQAQISAVESSGSENAEMVETENSRIAQQGMGDLDNIVENMSGKEAINQEGSSNSLNSLNSENLAINHETSQNIQSNAAGKEPVKLSADFLDNLENIGISDKTIQNLQKDLLAGNQDATSQLFKELANAFEEADLSDPVELASFKKLFSSDEYGKLLKENISNQWLLKPLDVEKKENIENLYQRLGVQAKALAESITNALGSEAKLAQSANNLSNNLDFMNQLNQMFQYVQLPLQMAGQNANGDLYVYRNKNKKMSEDGSVSAILHLDMESLGPVDVYVKLKDTRVTTNFYVADDSVIELLNDNIHILSERLEKRVYTMNANMMLHSDKGGENDAVDELLSVTRMPLLSTTAFDARA